MCRRPWHLLATGAGDCALTCIAAPPPRWPFPSTLPVMSDTTSRRLLVLYGSQEGCAESVAQRVASDASTTVPKVPLPTTESGSKSSSVGLELLGCLVAAHRAVGALVGSHHNLSTKIADGFRNPFIVGGHNDFLASLGILHPGVHALDHGHTGHKGQRLSWKTRRSVKK